MLFVCLLRLGVAEGISICSHEGPSYNTLIELAAR